MLGQLDYARQEGAADLDVMRNSSVTMVGTGSASHLAISLIRMGLAHLRLFDPDIIEPRNVTSQGFTWSDAVQRRRKVDALRDECLAINPNAVIEALPEDFVRVPDARLKAILQTTSLLLMTTDHHPAQARGALAALVCDVPVILASLYRRGRAGEIAFQWPGKSKVCYRCIARERYEHVARRQAPATGTANGSLPFAPQIVDAIVGHLAVAMLHNPNAVAVPRVGRVRLAYHLCRQDPGLRPVVRLDRTTHFAGAPGGVRRPRRRDPVRRPDRRAVGRADPGRRVRAISDSPADQRIRRGGRC